MVNNGALSSAFLLQLLLLLAVENQYADAFVSTSRNTCTRSSTCCTPRLYAKKDDKKKGFGSTSTSTKKRKVQKESKKGLDLLVDGDVQVVDVEPALVDLVSTSTSTMPQSTSPAAPPASMSPVMAAYELGARAAEMQQRGQLNGAVTAFADALALHPTADRRFLLGMALEENGEPRRAVEMYGLACQSRQSSGDSGAGALDADAVLRHDAAIKLADLWANDLGDVDRAIRYVDEAMAEEGYEHSTFSNAAAMDQKAFYLAEQGKLREAIGLWDAAIEGTQEDELAAEKSTSHTGGQGEADDDNISRAVARSHLGRFFRAVAKALLGDDQEAEADFAALPVGCQYMVDSWKYIAAAHYPQEHQLQEGVQRNGRQEVGRLFTGPYTILEEALASARPDGLVCEFGVFHGHSIRILASMVGPQVPVDGFDTFEGIPEAWGEDPAGTYTAASEIPQRVPDNVRFHVGLFSDTLPGYVAALEPPEALPVRLINVDCDLYQGTVEILHHLANRIGPGSVIVFDEYLMTRTWPEDEYKAFQEACTKFGWEYEYLSFSLFSKQAVVRITASESFVGLDVAP